MRRPAFRQPLAAALLACSLVPQAGGALLAQGPAAPPSGPEWARLARGEVVVATDPAGGGGRRAVAAAVLIDAPPRRVWEVMADCSRAPELVPGLKECRVLAAEGDRRTIAHRVKISSLLPEMHYTFREVQQPWHRIDFVRTGGDLREMEGSWTLEELDAGQRTLVRYRVSMDPGFLAPKWLVRQALRRNLPGLLAALRERAERGAG